MIENYELLRAKISGKTREEIQEMEKSGELEYDKGRYQLAEASNKETVSGLVVKFTKAYRKQMRNLLKCDAEINVLVKLDRLLSEGYMIVKKEKTELYLNRKQFLKGKGKAPVVVYTLTGGNGEIYEILVTGKSLVKGSYKMCQRKSQYYEKHGEEILAEKAAEYKAYMERKRRRKK